MKSHAADLVHTLLEPAAHQERTAEVAADVAHECERSGQRASADVMWQTARRCRVRALKLQADALAQIALRGGACLP